MLNIRDLFIRLRRDGEAVTDLELPSIPTNVDTGYGLVRAAIGRDNRVRLLLPVTQSEKRPVVDVGTSLSVLSQVLHFKAGSMRFIELVCHEQDLEPVFAELCEEVLHRIADGEPASAACRSTIMEFKKLLEGSERHHVSLNEIQGLVGELIQLVSLCRINPEASRLWLGPTGDRNDFRGKDVSLEVKSSSRESSSVRISSLDQLIPPAKGILYLVRFVLDRIDIGGHSVSSLFKELESLGVERGDLLERFTQIGCPDPHAPKWNVTGFNHLGRSVFAVTDDFPSITPARFKNDEVPIGVQKIQYEIDLKQTRYNLVGNAEFKTVEETLCQFI